MAHVVLCWLVTVQHSLQHTVTFVVEKKIDKNCGKENEEDNFVDKIKEVLKGRFCILDCVCGCYVCMSGLSKMYLTYKGNRTATLRFTPSCCSLNNLHFN